MFPPEQRLRDRKLFEQLFRRGTWVRGRLFSIVFLPAPAKGRIAFVMPKKAAKQATDRNSNKRRLRAAFREALTQPNLAGVSKNNLMVVILHKSVTTPIYADLLADVTKALSQVGAA